MTRNTDSKHKRPYRQGRSVTFRLRMTPEERQQLEDDTARAGYDSASEYVRHLIDHAHSVLNYQEAMQ